MSQDALRLRRLDRLLSMARADARQAELGLANALRKAEAAAGQRARIDGLIAGTGPVAGSMSAAPLAAGAQLRRLLQPILQTATTECSSTAAERARAEARLAAARTRADKMAGLIGDARRQIARERERRA